MKNTPHRRSGPQPSVTAIVEDLGWETLQNRRLNNQLTLLYKIVNNQIEIPAEYHPVPNNTRESRRCHNHQFTRLQSDINVHKYSFIPRTITDWNKLPSLISFTRTRPLLVVERVMPTLISLELLVTSTTSGNDRKLADIHLYVSVNFQMCANTRNVYN